MSKEQKTLEWQGDILKDTITYKYIELAANALELAVTENKILLNEYENWIAKIASQNKTEEELSAETALFHEFSPETDTKIKIFSIAAKNEFLTKCETPIFEVFISLSYNFEDNDIMAAKLVHFKGEAQPALKWCNDILKRIDEAFAKLEG